MRIELEFLAKELRELDGDQHRAEEERHGVCDGRNNDAGLEEEGQGVNEVAECERSGVDAREVEILVFNR